MDSDQQVYEDISNLVKQARNGDARAFESLVRSHLRTAVTVALGVTGRQEDAEDVVQESFIIAYKKIGRCRDPRKFSGWLMQIVRRQSINWLKSRNRREKGSAGELTNGHAKHNATVSRVADSGESEVMNRQMLFEALKELEMPQREIVLLHALEGWTHDEIAAHLKISPELSRWQLHQSRRTMERFIEKSFGVTKKVTHE